MKLFDIKWKLITNSDLIFVNMTLSSSGFLFDSRVASHRYVALYDLFKLTEQHWDTEADDADSNDAGDEDKIFSKASDVPL